MYYWVNDYTIYFISISVTHECGLCPFKIIISNINVNWISGDVRSSYIYIAGVTFSTQSLISSPK
jgi:hypothetical protein